MKNLINKNKGFSIVEVVVAAAIVLLIGTAFTGVLSQTTSLSSRALRIAQTSSLLEEGAEAVKTIRDEDWATISALNLNTVYYLSYNTNTNKWSLSTTPNTIDSLFTRTVVFSSVNRDVNEDISDTGTVDVKTKKVTINVNFNTQNGVVDKSMSFYISDIFN